MAFLLPLNVYDNSCYGRNCKDEIDMDVNRSFVLGELLRGFSMGEINKVIKENNEIKFRGIMESIKVLSNDTIPRGYGKDEWLIKTGDKRCFKQTITWY